MTAVVKFANANLPSTVTMSTVAASLRKVAADIGAGNGVAILKMDKTGHWVYGADSTDVEEGSLWAVNPFSFVHGFIAWGDGEVLGEKMVLMTEARPQMDAAPTGAKKGWEEQVGMSLQCVSGEDTGMAVRFTTTSVGGKKAVQELGLAIAAQIEKGDQTKPVPVVVLDTDHYQHKSYGRIFTPVFRVEKWVSMDGEDAAADSAPEAPAAEPAAAPEAPRRRRRVAS